MAPDPTRVRFFAATGSIVGGLREWRLIARDPPVCQRHRMRTARADLGVQPMRPHAGIPPVSRVVAGCAPATRGTRTTICRWRSRTHGLRDPIPLRALASAPAIGTSPLRAPQTARPDLAADASVRPVQHVRLHIAPWRPCARRLCSRAIRDFDATVRRLADVIRGLDSGLGSAPFFETDAAAGAAIRTTLSA